MSHTRKPPDNVRNDIFTNWLSKCGACKTYLFTVYTAGQEYTILYVPGPCTDAQLASGTILQLLGSG